MIATISKTELARNTREVISLARRRGVVMVESYGVEQVAVLDATDYRLLRAVVAAHCVPAHASPANNPSVAPRGLTDDEYRDVVAQAGEDEQAGWDRVFLALLDLDVSLGRAAELLGLSRFELHDRLSRLKLPTPQGEVALRDVNTGPPGRP